MQSFNLIFNFAFSQFSQLLPSPFSPLYCSDKIQNLCLVYFENLFWFNWNFSVLLRSPFCCLFFPTFVFFKKREKTHKMENERIINFPKHFPNELFALLIEDFEIVSDFQRAKFQLLLSFSCVWVFAWAENQMRLGLTSNKKKQFI